MDNSTSAHESTGTFPDGYTAPRTTEQLMQYHKDHSTHASADSIIPMHNIEERLKIIEEIRAGVSEDQSDKLKDFRFTYLELAYFLLCPESSLRKVVSDRFHTSYLQAQIEYMGSFLLGSKHYKSAVFSDFDDVTSRTFADAASKVLNEGSVRDNSYRKENSREQNQECDERIAQLERGKKNLAQKNAEEEKCLVRDDFRCVFTQNDSPKVYQILPFIASYGNWTSIQKSDASYCFNTVLGPESWSELNYFVCNGPDRCDRSWNMISLGPDLRRLWKRHFFGIQCLGILPIDRQAYAIWLQFHWMPRNQLDYKDRAELNINTIQKMLQNAPPEENDVVEIYRSCTHRPLETGHIFSIRMGKQEAISMKRVIDLRWAIVRIAAISGLDRSWSIHT